MDMGLRGSRNSVFPASFDHGKLLFVNYLRIQFEKCLRQELIYSNTIKYLRNHYIDKNILFLTYQIKVICRFSLFVTNYRLLSVRAALFYQDFAPAVNAGRFHSKILQTHPFVKKAYYPSHGILIKLKVGEALQQTTDLT